MEAMVAAEESCRDGGLWWNESFSGNVVLVDEGGGWR